MRRVAGWVEPGFGTVAAVAMGLGTLLLPFATMFFAHALSACLVFAAFTVLFVERRGRPRPALLVAAGVLAGLAITTEYPTALIGFVLGVYALARPRPLCAAWRSAAECSPASCRSLSTTGGPSARSAPVVPELWEAVVVPW